MRAALLLLLFAALPLSAEETTGSFRGRITSTADAALPTATVIVSNIKNNTREMSSTDGSGAFEFHGLPAGGYRVRVLKPGFAESTTEIAVEIGEELLQNARLAASGPEPPRTPGPPSRIAVAGPVQAAALTLRVVPAYPQAAKSAGIQGSVVLDAVIGRDGVPATLQVEDGANPDLARAAVEAVSQWRYRTSLLNGDPVEVQTTVEVNFTLQP